MNLSQDIIYNMGISLGGLEAATDYLYGNTDYYEPELTEIKSEIYNKEIVKPKKEKVVKPEIDNRAIARKFNFIRNKLRERNDKVVFEKPYIEEDTEFEALFKEDTETEKVLDMVRHDIDLVENAEELMSESEEYNKIEDIEIGEKDLDIDIELDEEEGDIDLELDNISFEEDDGEEEELDEEEGDIDLELDNISFEEDDGEEKEVDIDLELDEEEVDIELDEEEEDINIGLDNMRFEEDDEEEVDIELDEEEEDINIGLDNMSLDENGLERSIDIYNEGEPEEEKIIDRYDIERDSIQKNSNAEMESNIKNNKNEGGNVFSKEEKEDNINNQLEEYKRKIAELEAREKELEKKNKSNEYLQYSLLSVEELYKEVKSFMLEQGVGKKAVEITKVNEKFGSQNIKKLIIKSYLIKIGKGVTIGR